MLTASAWRAHTPRLRWKNLTSFKAGSTGTRCLPSAKRSDGGRTLDSLGDESHDAIERKTDRK
jgi:hypothetical protein